MKVQRSLKLSAFTLWRFFVTSTFQNLNFLSVQRVGQDGPVEKVIDRLASFISFCVPDRAAALSKL